MPANPDADARRSGQSPLVFPYRASIAISSALLISGAIGIGAYWLAPMRDPVGVVGVPVLLGYHEANEQFAFYLFWLSIIPLSIIAERVARRLSLQVVLIAGSAASLMLIALPNWGQGLHALPLFTLTGWIAFGAGVIATRWQSQGRRTFIGPWAPGAIVWVIAYPELPFALVRHPLNLALFLLFAFVIRWLHLRLSERANGRLGVWPAWVALFVVVAGIALTPWRMQFPAMPAGVACFLLGSLSPPRRRAADSFVETPWLVCAAVLWFVIHAGSGWYGLDWSQPFLMLAAGAGAGAVSTSAVRLRVRPTRLPPIAMLIDFRMPSVAVIGFAATCLWSAWFAFVTTATVVVLNRARFGRPGFLAGVALAATLLLALLPTVGPSIIDAFHDGDILSPVWEFETGRTLYADVFPIRGYQFFVTWISRKLLPSTMESYFFSFRMLQFTGAGGACLMAFAWTRSLYWSLATGLVIATCQDMDSRQGLHLWLAAAGLESLRSHDRRKWGWLTLLGCLSGLLGYDAFVPFVAGAVVAVFFVPAKRPRFMQPNNGLAIHLMTPLILLGSIVGSLTLLLVFWQGSGSAASYWRSLLVYSGNYNAACGLPVAWNREAEGTLLTSSLSMLGMWTAAGVFAWSRMNDVRRRIWIFVVVSCFFHLHRGLGRSDAEHLGGAVYLTLVLASLALFEVAGILRRRGWRNPWTNRKTIALSMALLAAWRIPHELGTPLTVYETFRSLSQRETMDLGRDDFVLERVGPEDSLWAIDHPIANYAHRRHNPVRQQTAFSIVSPNEQRAAVAALRRDPPKLIPWPTGGGVGRIRLRGTKERYLAGVDGIATPLRYYIISQYVYHHYQPSPHSGYLEPSGAEWRGELLLEPEFLGIIDLKRLPLAWGKNRWPLRPDRVIGRQRLGGWRPERDRAEDGSTPTDSAFSIAVPRWEWVGVIDSRLYNYLVVEFVCRERTGGADHVTISLEFAPKDEYEPQSRLTFEAACDGVARRYLIPVGCSPGWSWRPSIERIRLVAPKGTRLAEIEASCLRVDDLRP